MPIEMDGRKPQPRRIIDAHGNETEIFENDMAFCEGGCEATDFVAATLAKNLHAFDPLTGKWDARLANPDIWEE